MLVKYYFSPACLNQTAPRVFFLKHKDVLQVHIVGSVYKLHIQYSGLRKFETTGKNVCAFL